MSVSGVCLVAAALAVPAKARAQVAWESPMMLAPGTPAGLGLFLLDPHPSGNLAGLLTFRASPAPYGMGWRVGVTEEAFDALSVFGGVDWSGPLLNANAEFPLDMMWVAGLGAGYSNDGDRVAVGVPIGVSAGRVLDTATTRFIPYLAPRLVLNALLGGGQTEDGFNRDDLSVDITVDVGLDVAVSDHTTLRLAASMGDRDAVAVGINFGRVR